LSEQSTKPFLKLDASATEYLEVDELVKRDIELNRIEFIFPDGFNQVPIVEECRVLTKLNDFDSVYELMMKMLADKTVIINLKDSGGSFKTVAQFHITNKDMDLRGVEFLAQNPIVVNWMTNFVAGHLAKKYPRLSLDTPPLTTSKKAQGRKRQQTQ
jgi:hypothetical protein